VRRARRLCSPTAARPCCTCGHITLLEDCRRFGTKLVLGLNGDSSWPAEGPTRPIVGERERARVMAALAAVDAVVLFEEDTPLELIRALRPNVLVKGGGL